MRASLAPDIVYSRFEFDTPTIASSSFIQLFPQFEPVRDLITRIAKEYGVSPLLAIKIATCESGLDPSRVGDLRRGVSRGLWQINKRYHPYITDQQAHDPEWSTRWAIQKIKNKQDIWTCWK